MSEAKFTKGEWVVTTCGSNVSVWCDSNSITSAESFNYPDDAHRNEILANAHLIAAAPNLYRRLERARDMLISIIDRIDVSVSIEMVDIIRNEISLIDNELKKARGE